MEDPWEASAATFAQIVPEGGYWGVHMGSRGRDLDPRTAAVLAAVLLAAAEQVSAEKRAILGATDPLELAILALAMSFRADDTGLMGDVFEWSVLLAVNRGDSEILQMVADALALVGLQIDRPQAVLIAAEPGRLVSYSPELPSGATLSTGRRGRPPRIDNILERATTKTWKADLLLGSGDRWISASLKSNPRALAPSLLAAATTPYPPRIGITASRQDAAGVVRDPATDTVLVKLPVDTRFLALSRAVLRDVRDAFLRHLSLPPSPLQEDVSGIGLQLHRWRHQTVRYVVEVLLQVAGSSTVTTGSVRDAQGSDPDAKGALVAASPLAAEGIKLPNHDFDRSGAKRMTTFDPID